MDKLHTTSQLRGRVEVSRSEAQMNRVPNREVRIRKTSSRRDRDTGRSPEKGVDDLVKRHKVSSVVRNEENFSTTSWKRNGHLNDLTSLNRKERSFLLVRQMKLTRGRIRTPRTLSRRRKSNRLMEVLYVPLCSTKVLCYVVRVRRATNTSPFERKIKSYFTLPVTDSE